MKRAVLVVCSIVVFLISIPLLFVGILLTAWGTNGSELESDPWHTSSTGYAIVSDSVNLGLDSTAAEWFDPTVGVENQDASQAVFVGIGPTAEVDRYLAGVPQTLVYSLGDDLGANRDVEVPGSAVPEPPGEQSFWTQQASGTGVQELKLGTLSGENRFVAMNADGSAGVAIAVQGSVDVPLLVPAGIAAIVFGVMMLGLALLVLILGIRAKPPVPAGPIGSVDPQGGPPPPYPGQSPAAPQIGSPPEGPPVTPPPP